MTIEVTLDRFKIFLLMMELIQLLLITREIFINEKVNDNYHCTL